MITAKIVKPKIDRKAIRKKVSTATFRNLKQAGGAIRLTARRSIKTRKRSGGRRAASFYSSPGKPPKTKFGRLKESILFDYIPGGGGELGAVVIGPSSNIIGDVGGAHEHGGKFRGDDYEARPFMGPALDKNRAKIMRTWADSVR